MPEEVIEPTGDGKMQDFLAGTLALLTVSMVVLGAVAAGTGWLLPWLRRSAVRPKLWGYGTMLFGTGLLPLMSYAGVDVFGDSPLLDGAVAITGVLLMAAGGYLQSLSARAAS